jgi:hypothetical protein
VFGAERVAHDPVLDPHEAEELGTDDNQRPSRGPRDGSHDAWRNILPLQREGLIAVVKGRTDRRSKELRLTEAGAERLRAAVKGWLEAQTRFEAVFGANRTVELRALLHAVSASDLGAAADSDAGADA